MNKNVLKKGTAVLLATTMIGSFSGCKSKDSVLADTVLEKGAIVYVNDEPIIMVNIDDTYKHHLNKPCKGYHYEDIITGQKYHIPNPVENCIYPKHKLNSSFISLPEDTTIKSLYPYLEKEDINSMENGKYTDADLVDLQKRIANK